MTRVALIDGPLAASHPGLVLQERYRDGAEGGHAGLHATALAAAVMDACPGVELVNLVVFTGGLATDVGSVVAALDRAVDLAPEVVLCAFGLGRTDAGLAAACARAIARGCAIVAAAPARGGPVYPAALPGVVPVQGDARCSPATWSHLALDHAEFGAAPFVPDHVAVAGASAAAAHLAGHLAARRAAGAPLLEALDLLRREASFHGRERRSAV